MKMNLIVFTLFCFIISCNNKTKSETPNTSFEVVNADFITWWSYHNEHIILSSEFVAIDEKSKGIEKGDFLKKMTTGNYIPLKLKTSDESKRPKYKLFEINEKTDKSIKNAIMSVSNTAYNHFKMEGTKFPAFDFIDLNGKSYNTINTKGKIIFFKCWFINCKPCIEEFPQLNEFVDTLKNREDIIFISLALDSEDDLKIFLKSNNFNYATVSNQKEFIEKKLNVNMYPTHFLVDKDGIIKKVVNNFDELLAEFDTSDILGIEDDDAKSENIPPPPPLR